MTAYSRILIPPSPALSGTELTVLEDDGDKFPPVPFTALAWPVSETPRADNSEELKVIARDGDVFTVRRGADPISLQGNMMLGVVVQVTRVRVGEEIRLQLAYTEEDGPYTLRTCDPGGSLATYTGALGTDEYGDTVAYYDITPARGGVWTFRWETAHGPQQDGQFYAEYSGAV